MRRVRPFVRRLYTRVEGCGLISCKVASADSRSIGLALAIARSHIEIIRRISEVRFCSKIGEFS